VYEDQIMKIVNNSPSLDTAPTGKVEAARTTDAKQAAKTSSTAGADQFNASRSAKLANSAIDAATHTSDIRPEAVARAKALLADGKIGNDPQRLADALIDSLLKN
jgi:flagellar biosynthesis anti-sigma factor FlgM